MGLKESGLRGSLRNVSVGIDAIPDSEHKYLFENFSESIWEDSRGDNDITVNGLSEDSDAFNGVGGVTGDGSDDFGESNAPNINPTEPWAVAFSLNTTDFGDMGVLEQTADGWKGLVIGTAETGNTSPGKLSLWMPDGVDSTSDDPIEVETESDITDGNDYQVIMQNTNTNPNSEDIEIYLNDAENEVSTVVGEVSNISNTVFPNDEFGYYARLNDGSPGNHWNATKSGIRWFTKALDKNERESIINELP